MKKIILVGTASLVVLFSILIGLQAYALNTLEYQGADMKDIDLGSMSAPMTIRINNHSLIPIVVDKVEIISSYKGSHFASASFKDLYIPANKVSQHSDYLVIDRDVVQNLIFKGIA